jgi:hypothetical protein
VRTVLAGLSRVVGRFPFVCLAALVGVCAAILAVDNESTGFANVIMACALALPVMFALRIVAERRFPGRGAGLAMEIAGILLVAAYAWSVPSDSSRFTGMVWIRYALLVLGLHFAVAFAPCLSGADEAEYWSFNWRLFARFALTTLYSGVLYVGLAAALASCDKLFDLKVNPKRYAELWIVMAGLFHPLFFLSGVPPAARDPEAGPSYPGGLRAFAQFALAPLVVVYVTILYAYAGKIIIRWAWPHGWIAMPVCVLAVSGILAALLIQPARTLESERWAGWYWRYFFKALAPLSVLLILSIWRRESDYGVTEWRYYGMVTGVWLLGTSLWYAVRPRASTRAIPASLAAVCLLTVWGPWGVFSVSGAAQRHRLVATLGPAGLENGRIIPAKATLPAKEVESIRSIVSHLITVYGVVSLSDLLPADLVAKVDSAAADGSRYGGEYEATQQIVEFITGGKPAAAMPAQRAQTLSVDLDLSAGLPVEGYARVFHACICPGQPEQTLGELTVRAPAGGTMPEFKTHGKRVDGSAVVARIRAVEDAAVKGSHKLPPGQMSASVVSVSHEWLVVIDKLGIRKFGSAPPTLTELDIYVLEK